MPWRGGVAMGSRGGKCNREVLERVHPDHVRRPVRRARPKGEIHGQPCRERHFALVRKLALLTNFGNVRYSRIHKRTTLISPSEVAPCRSPLVTP
jgi:hypothetical protein